MPIRVRKPIEPPLTEVVDLGAERDRRRFDRYRGRVETVLGENKRALMRLFDTGMVFTRHGSRVGRELLQAQQNLLRANDLMARDVRDETPRGADAVGTLIDEIEALLDRTSAIARRNKTLFQAE